MANIPHLLPGAVIIVIMSLSVVHECDCSKYTRGADGCDQYTAAVRNCIGPNTRLPPNFDIPTICRIYQETAACMAALPTCDNPPADSRRWTKVWGEMEDIVGPTCSYNPDDTSCGNFDSQALTCLLPMLNANGSGPELCRLLPETKLCMDPLVSRCPEEAQGSNINQAWHNLSQMGGIPC